MDDDEFSGKHRGTQAPPTGGPGIDASPPTGHSAIPVAPVSTLLAKLVTSQNKNLKTLYDPTCGSGSLLLRVKREADHVDKIYGQELNRTTYNLARMNMILHDVHYADFDIRQ